MTPVECLALLRPTGAELELLRACLWNGEAARTAWAGWLRAVGDPLAAIEHDVSGVKSLLALLHRSLASDGAVVPGPRHVLAIAYMSDVRRWQAYATICARAFDALAAASIRVLVLKGAALSVSVYPDAAVRHSHDIDLLVDAADVARAARALRDAGFAPEPEARPRAAGSIRLADDSGLPIELHTGLYRFPYYTTPAAVWTRAVRREGPGLRFETLSPADHLLYVCGRAACCPSRDTLKWVADAWFLIRSGEPDWSIVEQAAAESRLSLPFAVLLQMLATDLDAPAPAPVLDRLAAAATAADRGARHIAISGVRAGRRGTFRSLFGATPSWRGLAGLAGWMLAPSPTSLTLGEPLRYPRLWPAYYAARPLAAAARVLRARLRGSVRRARATDWSSLPA